MNEKGISLVQVMIALALMAVAQLAFMRMSQNQNRSVKTTEVKFESIDIVNNVRQLLMDKDACHNTFGITKSTPNNIGVIDANSTSIGEITTIKNQTNVTMYQLNDDPNLAPAIGSARVKLLGLRIDSSSIAPISNDSKGVTEVFLKIDRGEVYGSQTIEKKFRLNVLTDSDGKIVDCSTAQTGDGLVASADYFCKTLGGTFDPDGRDGVGDCHSLSLNQDTKFNGDVILNDSFSFDFLSDRRLKHDVKSLKNSLAKIKRLRPVKYKWNKNSKSEIGFIAQEVKSIYPDFVSQTKSGSYAVKYPQMVSAALMGIKELDAINTENQKTIYKLLDEQAELKTEILDIKRSLCSSNNSYDFC